jgi:DNA-binding transcriptional ArsR family regulator
MDVEAIAALKGLTDVTRLRIVGAVAGREQTADEIAAALTLPLAVVVRQLAALTGARIVAPSERGRRARYSLRVDTLQALGKDLDELERELLGRRSAAADLHANGSKPEDARVLRAFIIDGRLESIPAHDRKRQVVLRYLLDRCFPDDRDYPEKEVNQRLALFHPDVAALRRYLVESRLMRREAGVYRRMETA